MRFFQKRRAAIDIDEQGLESIPHADNNSIDEYFMRNKYPFQEDTFLPYSYEKYTSNNSMIVEGNVDGIHYPKNKQSIGSLVRKLNCSASKKDDYDLDQHFVDSGESGKVGERDYASSHKAELKPISPPPKKDISSEITRPVLITVKNGDINDPLTLRYDGVKTLNHAELNSSFIVGELPKPLKFGGSSSFRLGMSARKRHHNATKYFKNLSANDNDKLRNGFGWQNKHDSNQHDIDARRAAQEAARRERWKRGLEMEQRMFKNAATTRRNKDRDDNYSSDDSLTMGSHTTGTSLTGYDTAEDFSSIDDWTDATEESLLAPRYHHAYHRSPSGGHCTSSQQVVESVAEDFGIFAKLLLSDGYACFGTAAEITKETVGNCN